MSCSLRFLLALEEHLRCSARACSSSAEFTTARADRAATGVTLPVSERHRARCLSLTTGWTLWTRALCASHGVIFELTCEFEATSAYAAALSTLTTRTHSQLLHSLSSARACVCAAAPNAQFRGLVRCASNYVCGRARAAHQSFSAAVSCISGKRNNPADSPSATNSAVSSTGTLWLATYAPRFPRAAFTAVFKRVSARLYPDQHLFNPMAAATDLCGPRRRDKGDQLRKPGSCSRQTRWMAAGRTIQPRQG